MTGRVFERAPLRHELRALTALGWAMAAGVLCSAGLACAGWLVSRGFGVVPRGYFVRALLASVAAWVVTLPWLLELCRRGVRQQRRARTFLGRVAGSRSLLACSRVAAGVTLAVHVAVYTGASIAAGATWGREEATLLLLFGATTAAPSALATWVAGHFVALRSLDRLGVVRSEDVPDLGARLPFELGAWAALATAPLLPGAAMFSWLTRAALDPALLLLGIVAPLVGFFFYEHGRRVVRDLERARGRVARIQEGTSVVRMERPSDAETREGAQLDLAVKLLVTTHDRLCEEELNARSSIAETQRLKTRFMAYMSHDLRSPLNAILGFSDMLVAGDELNAEQAESLAIVRDAAADLLRLVSEVLDAARLEAGKLKLYSAYVPVAAILSGAVGSARRTLRALGVELDTSVEPGVPAIYVDAQRMQQALVGLLIHLAHVSPPGSAIAVRVGRAAGPPGPVSQVRLYVDVPGMTPPGDPEELFQAFRVARRPSGTHGGGLGLGLYLARALVDAQGGAIWFEAPGTVCVALPRDGH
ncbi:MAG: histidine kinase dimerization/phospho-acceptor domain-containing protein [Polyangiales bacterium]